MARVTRKDIAKAAGVTETIVSYVMNGNRYVDQGKKERVLKAVDELGYVPSPMARALKGKTSAHIIFIADDMMSGHFGSIIGEMYKHSPKKGMLISLVSDRGDRDFVSRVINWSFDGIIIGSATISNEDIQTLIDTGIPVVLLAINNYPQFKGRYGLINTGLRRGAEEVMRALKADGRKKIAYAGCAEAIHHVNCSDYRYIGYMNELEGEEVVIEGAFEDGSMSESVKQRYEESHFDAVLARTDNTALVVISALKELGVRVPEDVAVVGFNESKMCSYTSPTLTSVNIKREEIAKIAMRLLTILHKGECDGVIAAELDTEIIQRESFRFE